MAEYYERESLIDALMMYTWRDEDEREIDDSDEKRAFIEEWLPDAPDANVRPVKRGKWYYGASDAAECSVCDYETDSALARNSFNFCPNCGADMRETNEK